MSTMIPAPAAHDVWKYTMNLNGLRTRFGKDTVFVPLPRSLWRKIAGGCSCEFCRAVPGRKAYWDTLAVSTKEPSNTWMVHDPRNSSFPLTNEETSV